MDGPLKRARAAKNPARFGLFLLKNPHAKIRKVIARIGLAA